MGVPYFSRLNRSRFSGKVVCVCTLIRSIMKYSLVVTAARLISMEEKEVEETIVREMGAANRKNVSGRSGGLKK